MDDLNVWCEVVCDKCCQTSVGMFYNRGSKTISNLRKIARKDGFAVVDGKTLCPDCVEKYNKERPVAVKE